MRVLNSNKTTFSFSVSFGKPIRLLTLISPVLTSTMKPWSRKSPIYSLLRECIKDFKWWKYFFKFCYDVDSSCGFDQLGLRFETLKINTPLFQRLDFPRLSFISLILSILKHASKSQLRSTHHSVILKFKKIWDLWPKNKKDSCL